MAAGATGIRAGRAYVELGVDGKPLDAGLKGAEARLKAFGAGVAGIGRGLMTAGLAAAAPLGLSVKAFTGMGDSLAKMSRRTGVSVESLSKLQFAAERSGAGMGDVEIGIRRMQRTLYDADRGLSTATDALHDLGLSMGDLRGLAPERQFARIAGALHGVGDASRKAALAQVIFGRSGTMLIPMIDQGARGLERLYATAERLGIVMSGKDAAAAEELSDRMGELWMQLKMVAFKVGKELQPALEKLAVSLQGWLRGAMDWIDRNGPLIEGTAKLTAGVVALGAALYGVVNASKAAAAGLGAYRAVAGFLGGGKAAGLAARGAGTAAAVSAAGGGAGAAAGGLGAGLTALGGFAGAAALTATPLLLVFGDLARRRRAEFRQAKAEAAHWADYLAAKEKGQLEANDRAREEGDRRRLEAAGRLQQVEEAIASARADADAEEETAGQKRIKQLQAQMKAIEGAFPKVGDWAVGVTQERMDELNRKADAARAALSAQIGAIRRAEANAAASAGLARRRESLSRRAAGIVERYGIDQETADRLAEYQDYLRQFDRLPKGLGDNRASFTKFQETLASDIGGRIDETFRTMTGAAGTSAFRPFEGGPGGGGVMRQLVDSSERIARNTDVIARKIQANPSFAP
ncbi:MAG TPA: hypothetical protein VMY35_02820 [Phycisphaerae bacterium]|nr:hypothetical protein [Phycisphaerae bacterium]